MHDIEDCIVYSFISFVEMLSGLSYYLTDDFNGNYSLKEEVFLIYCAFYL